MEPVFNDEVSESDQIVRISQNQQVGKVQLFGYLETGEVHKLQFFDFDDNLILEAGYDIAGPQITSTFALERFERLIGIQFTPVRGKTSRKENFSLIIGHV